MATTKMTLTPEEVAMIQARRAQEVKWNAEKEFQRKAITTAAAYEAWALHSKKELTLTSFKSFGYTDSDSEEIYQAIKRIQNAAFPSSVGG